MSPQNPSDKHNPASESREGDPPPAKIRRVDSDPKDEKGSGAGPLPPTSPSAQIADSSQSESEPGEVTGSTPVSSPCICRCNGCCCHGTASEPQHCVRCHTNYKFNHPEACSVPHVFTDPSNVGYDEMVHGDVTVPSVCCGADVLFGEARKGDWQQPFPCFVGWHTTDVNAVEELYNGVNVLRCHPGPGEECLRTPMKHPIRFEILYDKRVKYMEVDKGDHERYLERERKEMEDDYEFQLRFYMEQSYRREGDSEEGGSEEWIRKKIKKASRKEW